MSTRDKIDRVRTKLIDALSGVREELAKCQSGRPAVDSEHALQLMVDGLEKMLTSLETGERIEPPGLWYPISDHWPENEKLGDKIVDAELAYKQLK